MAVERSTTEARPRMRRKAQNQAPMVGLVLTLLRTTCQARFRHFKFKFLYPVDPGTYRWIPLNTVGIL